MKKYWIAFCMTQSMFCSVPFNGKEWDENYRQYMLLFLPVIGMEIGGLWCLLNQILRYFQVSEYIYGIFMCAFPYVVTGFIHLDGFMDVTDAIGSWRSLERRREILKDSHVGAFAVIGCIFLILTGFAMFASVPTQIPWQILMMIPIVSRCLSAMALIKLKTISTSQYAGQTAYPNYFSVYLVCVILACLLGGMITAGKYCFVLVAELIGYGWALRKSFSSLQGMNGDVSGFCICIGELCAILVLAFL